MSLRILEIGEEFVDYLRDESRRAGHADKITFPASTEDVREALNLATENGWPVTVQGGRTGITGGCVPEGGLILNLSRMNTIGPVHGECMKVQPGALLAEIRTALEGSGLFFPSDLTETTASIGGMVANNASGARSFKYGAVRNWIHGLEVVLSNGEKVRLTREKNQAEGLFFKIGDVLGSLPDLSHLRRCDKVKSAAGYYIQRDMDLIDLFIGAEGTLGVVTEITIKLLPRPEQINGLTAFFASEAKALEFVRYLRMKTTLESTSATTGGSPASGEGVPVLPSAIEFFDRNALGFLRCMKQENPAFSELPELRPDFHTAIYFEYDHEVPDSIVGQAEEALECWFAEGDREIELLKKFRHAIPEAVNLLIAERKKTIPELTKLGTDMSVPDQWLEAVMQMYHSDLAEAGLEYVIFGHIGNNHVHVNILPRSMDEYEQGRRLYLGWAKQVVEWGGSVSAEHGIGKLKPEFLEVMFGPGGIQQMRALKALFDPAGLLNPGNLFS